jgi:hypothetical protein
VLKKHWITVASSLTCIVGASALPAEAAVMQEAECNPGANEWCIQQVEDCTFDPQQICQSYVAQACGFGEAYDWGECTWAGGCPNGMKIRCYWSPIG